MEIVWTIQLETDTPGSPDAIAEAAENVRRAGEALAMSELFGLIGDSGSCEATVRIEP